MTKNALVLSMMMSLDGFIAGVKGELDWVHWESEMDQVASELLARVDAFAAGYRAFQNMAGYWSGVATNIHARDAERVFARQLCDKKKLVIGRKSDQKVWSDELSVDYDEITSAASSLRSEVGRLVVYGGVATAQALIAHDIVDELHLFISPVAIGEGQRLFASEASIGKKYVAVGSKIFPLGGISLNLARST